MQMLSDDDLNLKEMIEAELTAGWELWFELMQTTNDADPPCSHGVFAGLSWEDLGLPSPEHRGDQNLDSPVDTSRS